MSRGTGNPALHVPVEIFTDTSHLTQGDQIALRYCIEAVEKIEPIFLDQMGQDLVATGGVYERERATSYLYPEDLTREEFDAYLESHLGQREELLSPFTVVERNGAALRAVPYADVWGRELGGIARLLEAAALNTTSPRFAAFLCARAESFRTNNFKASDRIWIQTNGQPIELTIGPYESYDDTFYNVKRAFQGTVGVVHPEMNAEVQQYQDHVAGFDAMLGQRYGYEPKAVLTPMVAIDIVQGSGFVVYGPIFVATNLPSDEDIKRDVGSKKTFSINVILAKEEFINIPAMTRLLGSEIFGKLDRNAEFRRLVGHEASHGLPFSFGGEDFSEIASMLEELKADVFGFEFLIQLGEKGVVPETTFHDSMTMRVARTVLSTRGGSAAHGRGRVIQHNWFTANGAVDCDGTRFRFTPERFVFANRTLADVLYELAVSRDEAKAREFVEQWQDIPDTLRQIGERVADIPVDIDPVFVN